MTPKIGFACKLMHRTNNHKIEPVLDSKIRATTVGWLKKQSKDQAEKRLHEIMIHNLSATMNMLKHVSTFEKTLLMCRLGSDLLPMYTEPSYSYFWQQKDVQDYCAGEFAQIGAFARQHDIRLSFHPGQFCCIVSDNDDIVTRSVEELEYHSDMIRWMGFGKTKLDFKLNIHLSGKKGVDGFDYAWNKMSTESRNCLTLENDEYSQGLDNLLQLKNKVGIVLDIHHHLIKDEEYIQPQDDRIKSIIESWQGVRPVIHYSQSRHEYIYMFSDTMPSMNQMLVESTKGKLRQHSDYYNNQHINQWALSHLEWADIMAESKAKNLASYELFKQRPVHI